MLTVCHVYHGLSEVSKQKMMNLVTCNPLWFQDADSPPPLNVIGVFSYMLNLSLISQLMDTVYRLQKVMLIIVHVFAVYILGGVIFFHAQCL